MSGSDAAPIILTNGLFMSSAFRHEAAPYAHQSAFCDTAASLAREGLQRDERIVMFASGDKLDQVGEALGTDADDITFVDTLKHARNPARVTTMLHNFQAGGDGRRSLGISETAVADVGAATLAEALYSDAVLNDAALSSWPLSLICLFDTSAFTKQTRSGLFASHPYLHGRGENADYRRDVADRTYATPLDAAPESADHMTVASSDLAGTREFVRTRCARYGIPADRTDDLVLSVNEVVTNSLRYGGGQARLAAWFDGNSVVCEVGDTGHITDHLAGRIAPPISASGGRGLWLAQQLCDLMQVRSAPGSTVVRMYVDR